eukprot:6473426-Amphidinium_carterae.1
MILIRARTALAMLKFGERGLYKRMTGCLAWAITIDCPTGKRKDEMNSICPHDALCVVKL